MTNLLQAGQLSQGGLSRRVGKADTLGNASGSGSQAFRSLPGTQSRPRIRQTWAQVRALSLADHVTVTVGMLLHLSKPFSSSCNGAAGPASFTGRIK